MPARSATLVVLRHGQSVWNRANRFTGWSDVGLSEQGVADAQRSANNCVQRVSFSIWR